jgi:hypothetical protein
VKNGLLNWAAECDVTVALVVLVDALKKSGQWPASGSASDSRDAPKTKTF